MIAPPKRRFGGPNGYGSKLNPMHDARRAARPHIRELFAKVGLEEATTLPEAATLRAFGPTHRLDQGPTSACVGHAIAASIFTSLGAQRMPIPFVPSPKGIYTGARCMDRGSPAPPALQDEGSDPDSAQLWIEQFGVSFLKGTTSDGRFSDCEPDTINDEPKLGELEDEATFEIEGQYSLPKTDPNFETLVKTAIANGYAVNFATFVDTAFENWTPDVAPSVGAPDYNDRQGGGHDLYADSYWPDANGNLLLGIGNSWGDMPGDNGFWIGNSDFLQSWTNVFVMKVRRKVARGEG